MIKPIDLRAERRKRWIITGTVFAVLLGGYLYYEFKNYPEERQASRFFEALERKDYSEAYYRWFGQVPPEVAAALERNDYPEAYRLWQPARFYTFKDFNQDWGPEGIEGPIERFHITGSTERGSGVIVRVAINGNKLVTLWVEKKDKSISFPP